MIVCSTHFETNDFFLSKKYSRGDLHYEILLKSKSQKLYRGERTTKTETTQEAEEATGQLRTKKRSLYKEGKKSACL